SGTRPAGRYSAARRPDSTPGYSGAESRAQRTSGTAGNTSSATHGGRRYSAFQRRQHQPRAATVSAAITTTRTATGTATAGTQTPGRSHRPAHVRQPLPAAVGTRPPEPRARSRPAQRRRSPAHHAESDGAKAATRPRRPQRYGQQPPERRTKRSLSGTAGAGNAAANYPTPAR